MNDRHVHLKRPSPLAWLLMLPIRFYRRFISPMTPPSCRYYPVCSSYAMGALREHGGLKGAVLTAWRLLRCNPWSAGGIDRVPAGGRWKAPHPIDGDVGTGSLASDDVAALVTDDMTNDARDFEACALRPGSSVA